MTLSSLPASVPDLLRLLAVPVFAWVAIRDVRTRRVPGTAWIPLGTLGAVLLVWDGWVAYTTDLYAWRAFLLPAALGLGIVVPVAYLFAYFGHFGVADMKALLVLALLFPVVPTYAIGPTTVPIAGGDGLLPFSLSILSNGVLAGLVIPIVLAIRNGLAGRFTPIAALGWPIDVDRITRTHGKLLQTTEGYTLDGLDLDALRMYLRWRGNTLSELRADPDAFRDPGSLPSTPNPPTDGAVAASPPVGDGGTVDREESVKVDGEDPWGAAAFLDSIEGSAYGTDPDDLRNGLEVLTTEETVWYSPGTPFLVPLFVGLVIALVYGDVLVALIG